jgi:hypothetical protein
VIGTDTGDKHVGMMDLVVPTMTGANQAAVLPSGYTSGWNLTEDIEDSFGYVGGKGSQELAIYYEIGPPCFIRWTYVHDYAARPADDEPIFGYSDCDADTPNAQGMWRWDSASDNDTTEDDPYRVKAWGYNISRIPSDVATEYFGGDEMVLGPGSSDGGGSGTGPSFAVRPWTFPTDSGGWDEATLILYYKTIYNRYPRWYIPELFRGATDVQPDMMTRISGSQIVRIASGGDNYEALIFMGQRSIVDSRIYPYDSLTARPDETAADNPPDSRDPPGAQWDTYADMATAGEWPDMEVTPLVRYGIEQCCSSGTSVQQPSIVDWAHPDGCDGVDDPYEDCTGVGTGSPRMPFDSNIVSTCSHGTGPSASAWTNFLYLYDLSELGDMYAGTSGYDHDELQPYEEIDIQFDPGNDGISLKDYCAQPKQWQGMTYDETNQLLYISTHTDPVGSAVPFSKGGGTGLMVFSIEPPSGPAPPGTDDKNKSDGVVTAGGEIG